jgi:hypothetical protein
MSARTDTSRPDFVVAASLGTSGPLGNDAANRPFSYQPLFGCNHTSLTFEVTGTPTGTITVQVTDFGSEATVFGLPATQWANTTNTVALSGAAGTFVVNIPNLAAKFLRLNYAATSGTGAVNVAITCRANSR